MVVWWLMNMNCSGPNGSCGCDGADADVQILMKNLINKHELFRA
jgi:hypothetical protein